MRKTRSIAILGITTLLERLTIFHKWLGNVANIV
jgi:hypothetical protein